MRALGPVPDNDLATRHVCFEKGSDVLLHRHPPYIEEDRIRSVRNEIRIGPELPGIHPPPPGTETIEAPGGKLTLLRRRRAQRCRGRRVKSAHDCVAPGQGQSGTTPNILGELRVHRGGEGHPHTLEKTPSTPSERALGGNVHSIRHRIEDALADVEAVHRELNLAVGRDSDVAIGARLDDVDRMPHRFKLGDRVDVGGDDAVGLRMPGVRDDNDLHAARSASSRTGAKPGTLTGPETGTAGATVSGNQSRISMLPASSSTSAVQDSTQSPQLR